VEVHPAPEKAISDGAAIGSTSRNSKK